ncbi:MAG: 2-oxo acid dehydrogenase subunit E2 [Cloacibacterium sp.]|nr:2-oxo acid dehydrogenase subunit E2 [Cloacibacterium sp.]
MKSIHITLPKIGESTTEAKIVEWLKAPGELIQKDEMFVVIGTDKVDSELFSEYEGVLQEILVKNGEECLVGQAIAIMEVKDEVFVAKEAEPVDVSIVKETQEIPRKSPLLDKNLGLNFLSPVVRKMASENNLTLYDLQKIQGSGENGRIRKQDVEAYLFPAQKSSLSSISIEEKMVLKIEEGENLEPLSKMRKIIAEKMEKSWRSIPHVTTFIDADVSNLVKYRENIKGQFLEKTGTKLTYTHLLMKCVIDALQLYPQLNSWFNNEEWVEKKNINLGFAAALPDGNLIVPNLKNAQLLSVEDIAKQVSEIASRAKNARLKPDDITDTTFTVSNTGMFGSKMGTPIISQPQVAVLALGNILKSPWVITENQEEKLAIREIMALSISYDHRVIDGALASKFLMEVKKNIEAY